MTRITLVLGFALIGAMLAMTIYLPPIVGAVPWAIFALIFHRRLLSEG